MKACSTRSGQGGGASIVLRCIASNWIGVPDVPEHGLAGAANRAQFVAADLSVEPERVSAQRHGTGRPFRFVKRQNEGETERQRERDGRGKEIRNDPVDRATNKQTKQRKRRAKRTQRWPPSSARFFFCCCCCCCCFAFFFHVLSLQLSFGTLAPHFVFRRRRTQPRRIAE